MSTAGWAVLQNAIPGDADTLGRPYVTSGISMLQQISLQTHQL